ncbi:MAG TPA: glycosyltransferase family 4 protein [Candidatus Brocadiia bacterium]|nr:glycosyltransferase family 1 protein [Candidatus Brocadiales bacterium]
MKIAIAAILGTIGGPRTYAYNLIKALSKIDRENEYVILTDNTELLLPIEGIQNKNLIKSSIYNLQFPIFGLYDVGLYHNTKNALPLFSHTKSVVTIHDMAPFLFPESFTIMQRAHLKFHFRHAVKKAKKVITVSQQSRTDIINILGVNETKVVSILNGVSDDFHRINDTRRLEAFRVKHGLAKDIILCVSTLQPRKNIDVAIRAFSQLKRQKDIPHQLVIVGRKGWLWKDIMRLVLELNLQKDVIFIGAVEDEQLPLVYNLAEVFLNPSSYEGFGLTCLEAMACGVPVIATNVSSFPEVVGDAGILVTPKSVEELAQAIFDVLSNSSLRDELIKKGIERVKMFSWTQTAEKTIGVYKEVIGDSG